MLLEGKRIFVVEDNLENRIVVEVLLREQGAHVWHDRWGQQTVERLKACAPVDLVLLDLMFPKGITGYDIFDQIRAEQDFEQIPIVAISASDASEAIPKTRDKGFAGFISKPISVDKLPNQVKEYLDGRQDRAGGCFSLFGQNFKRADVNFYQL